MSKSQIQAKYGKEISKEDLKELKESWKESYSEHVVDSVVFDRTSVCNNSNIPGYPESEYGNSQQLIPVYDVEWLETDDNFKMRRYNTIRIGHDIYILRGEDKTAIRSKSNPNFCTLSVNGVYFLNRSQQPYSLILKCAHL
jgi:hypothetical protein